MITEISPSSHPQSRAARGSWFRSLADNPEHLSAVLLVPCEIVMVVNFIEHLGAENLSYTRAHPIATGVGVSAGQLHGRDVVLPFVAAGIERYRRRVHVVLGSGAVQEPGGDLVPETARTEMHADPDPILLVGENVHIVIPGAHGAELRA